MKKINLLVMLVLFIALIGASVLVMNNQETRSGASFASVEALFLPSTKTLVVGESMTTILLVDAKSHFLTGADLKIKYDSNKFKLENVTVLTKNSFSGGSTWLQNIDEVLISESDAGTGTYSLIGTNLQKDATSLPSGIINIVKLNFVAIASGEVRVGLDGNYGNIITGYNAEGSDQELGIEKVAEAVYTISETAVIPNLTETTTP